jgi:hypothetical protein
MNYLSCSNIESASISRVVKDPKIKCSIIVCLLFMSLAAGLGQDTLYLPNGNFIDGEIKSMDQGLLKIDTDYGDKDFVIEWI